MSATCEIATWTVGQIVVVTLAWLSALAIVRCENFEKSGARKGPKRDATDDTLIKQIEYHNKASYGAFEFFLKIALAVMAGMAYVAIQPTARTDAASALMKSGAYLMLLAAG